MNEIGDYFTPKVKDGKPEKPSMVTVDINLLGLIYSKKYLSNRGCPFTFFATAPAAHLAIYFLELERKPGDLLKSIVLLGSMGGFPGCFSRSGLNADGTPASWQAVSQGPIYSATKSGVLALARALAYPLAQKKIRVGIVHPFFTGS